jgi:hypothetical protein
MDRMQQVVNYYSLAIAMAVPVALVAFVLLRDGPKRRDWVILGGLVLALVVLWAGLHPVESTLRPGENFDAIVGHGTPVLLEYQSPY